MHGENRRGDRRNEKADEAHHARGNGRERARSANDGMHPAKKKAVYRAKGAAQICVFAACLRNGRAKLRERQRAKNGQHRANNPRRKNHGNGAAFPSHFRRLQKNAGADHGANDDRSGSPRAKPANQFEAFLSHQYYRHSCE